MNPSLFTIIKDSHMNSTTITVTFEELEVLHSVWEQVRNLNKLYPDLLMTGRQSDLLKPLNVREYGDLTLLRDRIGQGLVDSNQDLSPEELPITWEITNPQFIPHRKGRRPIQPTESID